MVIKPTYEELERRMAELKHAEETLARERSLLQSVMQATDAMLVYLDIDFNFVWVNAAYAATCNYKPEEMVGKNHFTLYPNTENEAIFRRVRDSGDPVFCKDKPFEFPGQRERGVTYWDWSLVPVKDAAGKVQGLVFSLRETTKRKRAEEALRESEYRLAQLQQMANLGSWSWDLAENRMSWSDETCRLYGLQPGESAPRYEDFLGFVHPEDRPRVEQCVQEALARGGSSRLDFRLVQRGGQERYVHCEARVILDSEGRPVRAEGALQDITERKRAEAALRASQENLALAQEIAHLGNWSWDIRTNEQEWSDESFQIFGFEPGECRPNYDLYLGLLHPEDRGRLLACLRNVLERNTPFNIDYRILRRDGSVRYVHSEGQIVRDDEGQPLRVFGTNQDITERKRAEEGLRESRDRYQALIETTADFIWEMDASGRYTYCSPQMKDLWGYEPKDMIGKTPFEVMPPEDRERAIESFMSLAKSSQPFAGLEVSSYDSQGRLIAIEISGIPFFDADGRLLGYRGISRDITERKRAQEALAESRKKYRGLVEKANDWVWEIDADGVYTYVSPRARELLGYAPEEIVGKTPFDLMPPAEAQRVWNAFESTWRGRKPLEQLENTLVRKDGRLVTVETSGMPVFAEDGTFLGYTGIDRDVTEHKQAEEALRESEERYRTLFESSPDGIVFTDMEGRILRTNPYYREMLGYSEEELRALTYHQLTPQRWQKTEAALVRDKIMPRGYSGVYEKEYVRKDGTVFPVSIQVWLIRDAHGEPQGMWGIVRDITRRKRAEETLRESEEKFRLLAETSPAAILIYQDDKYVYVNPAAGSLTGYPRAELLEQAPGDIVHPDYRRQVTQMIFRRSQGEGPPTHYELKVLTKDGREKWMDSTTVLIAYGNKPAGLVVAFDVTERKQAEVALRESEEKFAKAFRSSPVALAVTRLSDGRILDANEAMLKLLHFTADEVNGHTTRDLDIWVDLNDRAQFTQMLATAGSVRDLEYRFRTKDGAVVMVHLSAELLEFGGEPCVLSTLVDVTERERAEKALRQEKAFTDKLLNAPRDTVFLFEPETGQPIRWNQRFAEVSGYDDEEIAGMKADDFLDEHDLDKAGESINKVLAEGQGVVELSLVTKQGVHIPFEYAATVVETKDGKTLFLSIGRDITERKRAEEALRESEQRFRIMADGSPNAIWVTNAEGERIFANKQYLEYFGISAQEIEVGGWKPFILPEDAPTYINSFMSSLQERRPFSAEARVRRADGQWRWIESHAEPRLSSEGELLGFVGITQDVTQRKRAEESLREWNATLESRVAARTAELELRARQLQKLTLELTEAEERERRRLAEILHDDLQQVLAAAKFQVDLLAKRDAESYEIAEQTKDLLGDAIAKSRSLSHELSAPGLSRSNLVKVFEWLAEQMQTKHGFTVHLAMDERIELASEPLRVLLYKTAQELLFNAIKHAGVHEATLRLRHRRGRIQLSVSDKGRGFDSRELGKTSGFGLLGIRERVEYLGGRMKIRSTPGKGSIFAVAVPEADARKPAGPQEVPSAPGGASATAE